MRQSFAYLNTVENPQLSNPNPILQGWASLCYLRRLPDTSVEIGSKNRIITW